MRIDWASLAGTLGLSRRVGGAIAEIGGTREARAALAHIIGPDGRVIIVRNHEMEHDWTFTGPFGVENELYEKFVAVCEGAVKFRGICTASTPPGASADTNAGNSRS